MESDVVVVNHHLLLADLALKEDGFGDILGSADAVILDEAHQIPDLATQFFGASFSSRRIENVLRDVQASLATAGRHSAELDRRRLGRAGDRCASRSVQRAGGDCGGAPAPARSLRMGRCAHQHRAARRRPRACAQRSVGSAAVGGRGVPIREVCGASAASSRARRRAHRRPRRSRWHCAQSKSRSAATHSACCRSTWRAAFRRSCARARARGSSPPRRCPSAKTSRISRAVSASRKPRR